MCGILGIISKKEVVDDIYTGLYTLQHRGQDAAGIATFDGELHLIKDAGLIREIFDRSDLEKLKGKIGIGHVRYPTVGSTLITDAQPFFTNYPTIVCMAHNGNLVNYEKLHKMVVEEYKITPTSRCDVEIILGAFAAELAKQESYNADAVFKALGQVMEKMNGSYSVVVFMQNALLAFRDPHGIKPLVFGKKDGSFAFSSETVALDVLEYEVIKDVQPGEAIYISKNLEVTSQIIKQGNPHHCMFEWVYFARPDSVIEKRSVYEARLALGKELARAKKVNGDVIIPVPETSRPASVTFSDETAIIQREGLIKSRYVDRTFIMPTQKRRESAIKLKLNPIIHEIRGRRVILIDDSLVRGTTSKRIVSLVKNAGAKEVHLFFTCPPIRYSCFYGIDMATRKELAAANKSIEEICKEIGADSLTYQTIEGLKRAIGLPLCTACLDGQYPTEVTEKDVEEIEHQRENERTE
jgi:amidophosphoribosyltransferase